MPDLFFCRPSTGDEEAIVEDTEHRQTVGSGGSQQGYAVLSARVVGHAEQAIPEPAAFVGANLEDHCRVHNPADKLARAIELLRRVMDQTEHRLFKGEKFLRLIKSLPYLKRIATSLLKMVLPN